MATTSKQVALGALLISVGLVLAGCTDKPGSEGWCLAQKEIPKGDWTRDDTRTYAKHCIFEDSTIGSDAWCQDLDETPKGKWTTEEVAQYGQYCVVK